MKKFFILLFGMLSCNAFAGAGIDITDPAQVNSLVNIHESLNKASSAITACMDAGGKHKDCMCKHRGLIEQFNESVNHAMAAHKEFEKMDLVHFRAPDGSGVSQSLSSMRKQASTKLSCT